MKRVNQLSSDNHRRTWKRPAGFVVGMSAGMLIATTLMHGFPSTRETWSDFGGRVAIIVAVTMVIELVKRRTSARADG